MTISIFVFILVVIFGSSSWIGTNSVWVQLPLLVSDLPEQWSLPSYLACVVQIGCIGPLVYSIIHKGIPRCSLPTIPLIGFFLVLACFCQLGLVFFWDKTAAIGEKTYSVALYGLIFGLALVNSISNVLFLPFMAQFHRAYLNAYFVGMGCSSLVPSLLSLVQGTGNYECIGTKPQYSPPRFSVSVFFIFIFAWTVLAAISFLILHHIGAHKEADNGKTATEDVHEGTPLSRTASLNELSNNENRASQSSQAQTTTQTHSHLSFAEIVLVLVGTALVNAQMNGIITSIQSYATLPYSQAIYHYSVVLSNVVSPLASFVPFFFTIRAIPVLTGLTLTSSVVTAFIVYLATLSPHLIFDSMAAGSALAIVSSLVAAGLHSYLRIVFASLLREGQQSENQLFWCGVFIQVGSFLGTAVMFPLVNVAHVFKPADACPS
ncbi:unnamed protein product [Auanema sp. JU1783]|nr:unnamed protein product [Auanema sp. JU1783]